MAKTSSYVDVEFAALIDTYAALVSDNKEPTIVNCGVLLLDSNSTEQEARRLLNRFRVSLSRKYGSDFWKLLGVVRPSLFFRKEELGYIFFMVKGQRGITSYD